MMKVLIINASDIQGGAARATYRLHQSLLEYNIDSTMLVQNKASDDFTVLSATTRLEKIAYKLNSYLDSIPSRFYKNKTPTLFSPALLSFSNIVNKINAFNPDVVHLHWICAGMLTIEDLAKIKAPIVWTLHDNWAFTGGCHVKWECEKYKQNCGKCPRLGSDKENDLSRKVFNKKQKVFSKLDNLTIITPSRWMFERASESSLLKNKKIINIPNPLDTDIYSPVERDLARQLFNLPLNKKIILFGANSATSDLNKGFQYLKEALDKLKQNEIELVVFGSSEPEKNQEFKFKTHYLGYLFDDISLRVLYSAANVMVVPSLQEAFGQTASESMACGTPVVAFAHSGLLDIVDHQKNGYLAKAFDTTDLANGIEWIVNYKNYEELCKNARKKVVTTFDSKIVAKQYIDLYASLI